MGKSSNHVLKRLKEKLQIKDPFYMLSKQSRGIASKIPLKKNTCIIAIPDKFIIKESNMPYYTKLDNYIHRNSIFAYFLYCESKKGKESDWYFFLRTFPSKMSVRRDYPIYLSSRIKNQIKDTKFVKSLQSHEKEIKDDYEYLQNYFKKSIDYNIYLYYRILVTARVLEANHQIFMVPYIDLFNHSSTKNSLEWFYKDGYFCFYSIRNISSNTEIFCNYGHQKNDILYLFYGFTLPSRHESKKFPTIQNINLKRILP